MSESNRNYSGRNNDGGTVTKVGLFAIILGVLYFLFQKFGGKIPAEEKTITELNQIVVPPTEDSLLFLPISADGEVVIHQFYILSYLEKYEVPEWVAYELTAERLQLPWVERSNNFRPDPKVSTGSASPDDYRNTRFDRGHLVPAADMAFSNEAMSETFFLSNITPQEPAFNKGIWRELEELGRDWAKRFGHLYIVSGPVFNQPVKFWLGENQVAVPPAFFKVILDWQEPEKKAIAYVIPNALSTERIENFATSVDEVEKMTGIDFFPNLLDKPTAEKLEANFDASLWKSNEKKYQLRVQKWNLQN